MLRLLLKVLFTACVLTLSPPKPAFCEVPSFSLKLASDLIDDSETPALERFLADAENHLPPQFKQALPRTITVRFTDSLDRWRPVPQSSEFLPPHCGDESSEADLEAPQAQTRGRVSTSFFQAESRIHEVQLNVALKKEILKGPNGSQTYACGHGNLYRLAMATLLHELSHIYDFSDFENAERHEQLGACRRLIAQRNPNPAESLRCDQELDKSRVVSHLPTFNHLMDWTSGQNRNVSTRRSPDPYERTKIEETFAVNMEYFLMDPEFACRRPTVFEYLKDHFDFDPFPQKTCTLSTSLELSRDALGNSSHAPAVQLDPARIYQIHYLFASEGPMLMSRWGHAMFRIIVCNASRREVGPACLNDLQDHIVISYRANPGDWTVNAWKGLTGAYPSQMFLYRLYPQIVNEYTIDQFRDLISLPLKLSDVEKTRFIYRVIEQYWGYQGKYYFISNNCATESLSLLKGVIRTAEVQNLEDSTPSGLYEDLAKLGLIDPSILRPQEESLRRGYLFLSQKTTYEGAFQRLRNLAPSQVPYASFDEYTQRSSAAERRALYETLKALGNETPQRLASRIYILETFIFRAARNAFMTQVMAKMDPQNPGISTSLQQILNLRSHALPLNQIQKGYGIPLALDFIAAAPGSNADSATNSELDGLYQEFMQWTRQVLEGPSKEADAMADNQKYFLSEMRKK